MHKLVSIMKSIMTPHVVLAVEIAGDLLSHSLALLSDAGHVLTDIAAIRLSWFAVRQSQKSRREDDLWL